MQIASMTKYEDFLNFNVKSYGREFQNFIKQGKELIISNECLYKPAINSTNSLL